MSAEFHSALHKAMRQQSQSVGQFSTHWRAATAWQHKRVSATPTPATNRAASTPAVDGEKA